MTTHTVTPAVRAVRRCKANAGLRRLPRGPLTRTRLSSKLRLHLEYSLKTIWFLSVAVQFPRVRHHSQHRHRWVGVKGQTHVMDAVIPNILQSGAFVWFEKKQCFQ
ncbi:uncharacterized protein TNCV_1039201 [Trichonephila clavipes]|uniref:Uncharacterized protein n=1 Tax=Trichonephila clavipes TaxID=2585209 RepID=A0A8X6VWD6_TRICX|nr:uncharacterized protein TNCV_1039201 [Trichonephila clavipes]